MYTEHVETHKIVPVIQTDNDSLAVLLAQSTQHCYGCCDVSVATSFEKA